LSTFNRQNVQYTRLTEEAHREFWRAESVKALSSPGVEPDTEVAWVKQAREAMEAGKHVLLLGTTGMGKSTICKAYTRDRYRNENCTYLPCLNTAFEFSLLSNSTKVAVADDINLAYFEDHRQMLIRLLDGGIVSTNPKCSAIREFVCTAQFIFASNFDIVLDSALARRIQLIRADKIGYKDAETCNETNKENESPPQGAASADASF